MVQIPFGYLPGHWGLSGKTRERARIEYEEKDPEVREKKLAELEFDEGSNELKLKLNDIDFKFGRIDEYTKDKNKIEILEHDENIKKIKLLDHDLKWEKISELDWEREKATLNGEPWVGVKSSSFDKSQGPGGLAFELDFNDRFIQMLTDNGYKGVSDEQIVDQWFNDLCKSILTEEGLEEFIEEIQEGKAQRTPGQFVNKDDKGDGLEEYS